MAGDFVPVPDWFAWENHDCGLAVADIDRGDGGRPELVVLTVDNPPQRNTGYLRMVEFVADIDQGHHMGVWRLLDFGTGSTRCARRCCTPGTCSSSPAPATTPISMRPNSSAPGLALSPPGLDAPHTPIDLFCVGQSFLPDGRLLAAGGTARHDPFYGLKDALIFDPITMEWSPTHEMTYGRWYPSLVTLADGDVVAVSGLGADNNLSVIPSGTTRPPRRGPRCRPRDRCRCTRTCSCSPTAGSSTPEDSTGATTGCDRRCGTSTRARAPSFPASASPAPGIRPRACRYRRPSSRS